MAAYVVTFKSGSRVVQTHVVVSDTRDVWHAVCQAYERGGFESLDRQEPIKYVSDELMSHLPCDCPYLDVHGRSMIPWADQVRNLVNELERCGIKDVSIDTGEKF